MAFIQGFFRLFVNTYFFLSTPLLLTSTNTSFDVEPCLACHWLEREANTAPYFFLPKSAGTSPHWAVSHFLTSACCGCALNQLSARAIMSNKGAVFFGCVRASFCIAFSSPKEWHCSYQNRQFCPVLCFFR